MTKFKWLGTDGYNPLLGQVTTGQEITIQLNQNEIDRLKEQKLIEEIHETKKTSKQKEEL